MLFNSYLFVFTFLPITLAILFLFAARARKSALGWLLLASLVFYGGWQIAYVPLLLASIFFNYAVGAAIIKTRRAEQARQAQIWLGFGVACDLLLLGYFKYAGFFGEVWQEATGLSPGWGAIALPLGISFFTFTQIAYLIDAHRDLIARYSPLSYGLFVTYFPHLIAGPILHHREMVTQFEKPDAFRFRSSDFAAGITLFAIGLTKKVILADSVAPAANAVFAAANSATLTLAEAWVGTLAYCMQIYFDFSGYSDMALGLSLMMGIRLPLNFNSPYKALSVIEFWRRWHMTLSRFLRDYLYFSLGGNRHGPTRRFINLMVTMLLGGLWHGASWTFVIWGGLHGIYLIVNHLWRISVPPPRRLLNHALSWLLTFLAINVAWVFFRADSIQDAIGMIRVMFGSHGVGVPQSVAVALNRALPGSVFNDHTFPSGLFAPEQLLPLLIALLLISIAMPNSQAIMAKCRPAIESVEASAGRLSWSCQASWAAVTGALLALCISWLGGDSPFLYFRF
jgi:D-alanyl-lipoteichoic acid acyltransferase DltB (MBOAT superfamily)